MEKRTYQGVYETRGSKVEMYGKDEQDGRGGTVTVDECSKSMSLSGNGRLLLYRTRCNRSSRIYTTSIGISSKGLLSSMSNR